MVDFYYEVENITRDYFRALTSGTEYKMNLSKIRPTMYKQALIDLQLFGKTTRYPVKWIYKWKEIVINNIAHLEAFTNIFGHSSYFPFDAFNDEFETNLSGYGEACDRMAIAVQNHPQGGDVEPKWPNGHWFVSDYGLPLLLKVAQELYDEEDPSSILRLIDRALNITHPRSDLSELLMEGGFISLDMIAT